MVGLQRHPEPGSRGRGACACGWPGTTDYPIGWEVADAAGIYEPVIEGPQEDWERHLDEVEARTVPLPEVMAELLERVGAQLNSPAAQAPVAALKAVAALEEMTRRVARDAAYMAEADELSWESIATSLGLTEGAARSRLKHDALRH
ncbi:hypothetical protein ACFXGI_02015 [Streptomyces sp. NPDC059355]|uniref:hypothetical protein n=1 Tax=Streptomyces sp. NPDC059355 TaxID=3346811 RepID=UPI00367B3A3B